MKKCLVDVYIKKFDFLTSEVEFIGSLLEAYEQD